MSAAAKSNGNSKSAADGKSPASPVSSSGKSATTPKARPMRMRDAAPSVHARPAGAAAASPASASSDSKKAPGSPATAAVVLAVDHKSVPANAVAVAVPATPKATAAAAAVAAAAAPISTLQPTFAAQQATDYGFEELDRNRLLGQSRHELTPVFEAAKVEWKKSYFGLTVPAQQKLWNDAATSVSGTELKRIVENKIVIDWRKMPPEQLKTMCRGGIPAQYRADVWWQLSGADIFMAAKPNYFQSCVSRIVADSKLYKEIARDVDRTFLHHPFFRDPSDGVSSPGRAALQQVLSAYAIHNPTVGYCQSMNFLAALLLLFFTTERAFLVLIQLIDRIIVPPYYTHTMTGAHADMYVLRSLVRKRLPKLFNHFENKKLEWAMPFLPWHLCLFINTVPIETALRIWDTLFMEGDKVLFRADLTILHANEAALLAAPDAEAIYRICWTAGALKFDAEAFMKHAFTGVGGLGKSTVVASRKKHHARVIQKLQPILNTPPASPKAKK